MISSFGQDLRFALRQLRRSLGFTAAVVLTLALGIGLNAAIFTMVDCVLLRPLGYQDADRIFSLNTQFTRENRSIAKLGGGDYVDLARDTKTLEQVAYYGGSFKDGVQLGDRAVYTDVTAASPKFLAVMGVEPAAGRLFSAEGADNDVVVSSGFARDNFGSIAGALEHPIRYNGKPRVIVGVLPDGFAFPGKTKVWVETTATPDILNRTAYNQRAIGKLRGGVAPAQLSAELSTLSQQLGRQFFEDRDKALIAVPLQEQIVGNIRPLLRLMMGSVFVVLLIVCANVTHLQLVRSTRRMREIGIRTALGATRADVAWRALLEALILAGCGCAGGIAVAQIALSFILRMAPADIPRLSDVHLNWHVILFSFGLSLAVMMASALLPVFRSWRTDPMSTLKQDAARGTESGSASRLRDGLVMAEVSLTLVLSVASIMLMRQLIAQSRVDLGFDADKVALLELHAPSGVDAMAPQGMARLENILNTVGSMPGVESAAAVSGVPTGSSVADVSFAIRGRMEFVPGAKLPNADIIPVTTQYFNAMRIPLLHGRLFSAGDAEGSEDVVLISKELAKDTFPGQDPIGQEIMCGFDQTLQWMRIVGVVGDVLQDSPGAPPYPTFYVPIAQHSRVASDVQLVIRTSMPASTLAHAVQTQLEHLDPTLAIGAMTLRESVGESERSQHFRTLLFSGFAGLSVLLAAIGMYGVTAYSVAQRRFEIALRFALGASRGRVLSMVLSRGLRVATLGCVIGLVLTAVLMRVLSTLLGKVDAVDAWSYGLAVIEIMLIALAATFVPARQAASIQPMDALRTE